VKKKRDPGNLKKLFFSTKCLFLWRLSAERKEYLEKVLFEFKRKQETKSTGSSGSSSWSGTAGLLGPANMEVPRTPTGGFDVFFCWKLKP